MTKRFHWSMAMWVGILFQPVRAATPVAEPGDIQRIVSHAKASAAAGDFEQAWQAYSAALQKNGAEPNPLPDLLVERALVRIEMGDFSGAAVDCIVQLDAEPHSPRAMGVLGLVRFLQGDDEQAHLDLKAADDADGAVGREMVGRAKALAARLKALHKLDRSKPKPVVDALVNVWKGESKAKDGSRMEQEFRVDSRGIYQHKISLRDEGKIETQDGTISFVGKGGKPWQWKYKILEDGTMRVGGPDGIRWTHPVSDASRGAVDSKLQGIWQSPITGRFTGNRTFVVQLNGEFVLQNNGSDVGVFKAADGKWSMASSQLKAKDPEGGLYTLSAGGTRLDGVLPGVSLAATGSTVEPTAKLTEDQRKRMLKAADFLFAGSVQTGDLLLDEGKIPEAIAQFEAAIAKNPKDGPAFRERGRALAMSKKYKEAEGDFTTALTINESDGLGLLYRAFCRISLEDYTGAMADNDAAMKLLQADDPQRWLTYRIRGTIHQVRGKATRNADELRAALVDFTTAIRMYSKNADSYVGRGLANLQLGDDTAAQADFDAAIRLNPALHEKLPPIIAREKSERGSVPR